MNAKALAEVILELIESYDESGADALGEPALEGVRVETFADAGVMTASDGVVVCLATGAEFQVTVVRSKEARR
jgi:hypothetical protein